MASILILLSLVPALATAQSSSPPLMISGNATMHSNATMSPTSTATYSMGMSSMTAGPTTLTTTMYWDPHCGCTKTAIGPAAPSMGSNATAPVVVPTVPTVPTISTPMPTTTTPATALQNEAGRSGRAGLAWVGVLGLAPLVGVLL